MKKVFIAIVLVLYSILIVVSQIVLGQDANISVSVIFELISFLILSALLFTVESNAKTKIQFKVSLYFITIMYAIIVDILNIGFSDVLCGVLIIINTLIVFLYLLVALPIYCFSKKTNNENTNK